MHLAHSLTIRRAPGEVFRWIADPARAVRWQPDVQDYEVLRAVPGVVGTEFRERVGDASGSLEMHGRIDAYEPDRMMGFVVAGRGIRVLSRYALRPDPVGTRLSVDLDVRMLGPLSILLAPFLRPRLRRQVRSELEKLRVLCESEPLT